VPDRNADGYLPIEHYGAIGNLRTVALVGLDGSIDWCCLPELDRPSIFGAILDSKRGGRFRLAPAGRWGSEQRYLEATNVLETLFEAEGGRLSVTDFMPLHGSILGAGDPLTAPEIHRIVQCEQGEVEVEVEWSPRFDYARAIPRIKPVTGGFAAEANGEYLTLGGLPANVVEITRGDGGPALRARSRLVAGERLALVTRYGSQDARTDLDETLSALETTVHAWREWAHHCERPGECAFAGAWHPQVIRSGLALKLLTHPDTGAIAAAATASLPEEIGGVRNWDYRFTWIRDAAFTAQALFAIGHRAEALDFLNWAHRVCMVQGDGPAGLQIMYGLHGETELPEFELEHLEGYRGSRPVRIGNGAAKQRQLDIYGELLGSAYELVRMGRALDPPLMAFLSRVADQACEVWREPDYGIWEVRGGPQHFVYSKVMVWVALDRAVRMAERWGLPGRVGMWRRNRDAVRQTILAEGYDRKVGAFVQSFGSRALDASNLLIPIVEFLPFDDPRVQGTIDRTLEHLTENGLVYRYLADDGLPGGEGAFGLTTFWMVDALALSGRLDEAREMFEGVARRTNHLGLYSEEFDPRTGAFLGNFPQAFSHIGFINSALYLARAEGRTAPTPAPVGSREHGQETGHETGAAA
jgi:GH15 family glucan-1,4-alpha-glucosidase